jgi:hypothetical protein
MKTVRIEWQAIVRDASLRRKRSGTVPARKPLLEPSQNLHQNANIGCPFRQELVS